MNLKDIPRIRLTRDEDGLMIARGGRQPYRNDHLFECGSRCHFGIYISRKTPWQLRNAIAAYRKCCGADNPLGPDWRIAAQGDIEAIIHFETACPEDVPEWFKKSSQRVSMGQESQLARRLI